MDDRKEDGGRWGLGEELQTQRLSGVSELREGLSFFLKYLLIRPLLNLRSTD